MKKGREMCPKKHNFQVDSTYSCLASSFTTICGLIHPQQRLDPYLVGDALLGPRDYYLVNLVDLITETGLLNINHQIITVIREKAEIFHILKLALSCGAICEVGVKGTPFVEKILGQVDISPDNSGHSLVVYGFYQPDDSKDEGYYYVADSFSQRKLFIKSDDLYSVILSINGRRIEINLFNLPENPPETLTLRSIKKGMIRKQTKQAILSRLKKLNPEISGIGDNFCED